MSLDSDCHRLASLAAPLGWVRQAPYHELAFSYQDARFLVHADRIKPGVTLFLPDRSRDGWAESSGLYIDTLIGGITHMHAYRLTKELDGTLLWRAQTSRSALPFIDGMPVFASLLPGLIISYLEECAQPGREPSANRPGDARYSRVA